MGSLLYSHTKSGVWWIDLRTLGHLDDLALNNDGTSDLDPNNDIRPFTVDITHEPFFAAVLQRKDFNHVIFPHDWRKSLHHSATSLRDKIVETYNSNGNRPVHLVGHSLGGMLIRTMLMKHAEEVKGIIGRIAFLGTPHYGSTALASYLKNHLWGWDFRALLGRFISRETFRTLRGVLNLMPAPRGIYPGTREGEAQWQSGENGDPYVHPCANFDMYNAKAWKLELDDSQTIALQTILDETAEFHRKLHESHENMSQEVRNKMAVVAGVGFKTLFRLEYDNVFFGLWERTKKVSDRKPGDPHREGDATVPLASAALENIREIRYIKGEHGKLPMIPAVYEDVFRWLNGEEMKLPKTPAGALAQRLSAGETQPVAPNLTAASDTNDEIDYWSSTENSEVAENRLNELQEKLAAGQLPDFIKVKIL